MCSRKEAQHCKDTHRSRGWVFTLNNYTEEDWARVQTIPCQYIVVAQEVCPTTGTPHLQGYIQFKHAKSKRTIRKKILPGANVAYNIYSASANRAYCLKIREKDEKPNEVFHERGDIPMTRTEKGQASIDKWQAIRDLAKANRINEIEAGAFVRHYNTLNRIAEDYRAVPKDLEAPCGFWFYGPSGSGKTTAAQCMGDRYYIKDLTKWWDKYEDEDVVIVDDMDPYHKDLAQDLKRWTDKFLLNVQIKGKYRKIRPKMVIITSQYSIDDVWDDEETRVAIKSRCFVRKFEGPNYRELKKSLRRTPDQIFEEKNGCTIEDFDPDKPRKKPKVIRQQAFHGEVSSSTLPIGSLPNECSELEAKGCHEPSPEGSVGSCQVGDETADLEFIYTSGQETEDEPEENCSESAESSQAGSIASESEM